VTFKDVYKAGNGYAPVRLLIRNESDKEYYYNFKGVKDAFGNNMKDYDYQTSVLSTYQIVRDGADADANIRNGTLSSITTNPYIGWLKAAYYIAKGAYSGYKDQKIADGMKVEGVPTNYRAGIIKANCYLYIELGSIPVDGTLNNKGWATTTDATNYSESYIGPAGSDENKYEENAKANGVGVKFWGETTGFWDGITGDFFNFNINLEQIPGSNDFKITEDTSKSNKAQVSGTEYHTDGGGLDKLRTDFINITIK